MSAGLQVEFAQASLEIQSTSNPIRVGNGHEAVLPDTPVLLSSQLWKGQSDSEGDGVKVLGEIPTVVAGDKKTRRRLLKGGGEWTLKRR
jgi:hypothetical protein